MPTDLTLRAMNAAHRALIRVTRGRYGWSLGTAPALELTTTGRRTGRPRTTMLTSPPRLGEAYVVVASRGGDDHHPAWFCNLRANPEVRVAVYDGKEHPVDSKDIAFQIAGREAFKEAFLHARPVLLEPIYLYRIVVPEEYAGAVMSDLNTRRGRVQGMGQEGSKATISAEAPLAEMLQYTTNLRALTQARGTYSMEFVRYDVVPAHLAEQVIAQAKKAEEE